MYFIRTNGTLKLFPLTIEIRKKIASFSCAEVEFLIKSRY